MSYPPPLPRHLRRRSRPRQTRNPAERGLGWAHRQQVARLMAELVDGTPCWWCGHGMYRTQRLAGDHSVPRAHGGHIADRLLHLRCNAARGDGSRDHLRPALGAAAQPAQVGTTSRAW